MSLHKLQNEKKKLYYLKIFFALEKKNMKK